MHYFSKHWSDLSLFKEIVLLISKFLQILELTVGQNNFENKIPFLKSILCIKHTVANVHNDLLILLPFPT